LDASSSDSNDEGLTTITFNKSLLFPKINHTFLVAKDKKVYFRDTPKYTSTSDDDSSDDEEDMSMVFKVLERTRIDKINELIKSINEKYELLEKQEYLLFDEHGKLVNLEKALAHEKEKNKILSKELVDCNYSISMLKSDSDDLNDKIMKLNECHASSSSIKHVSICNRCKDDVDSCISNVTMIASLNDEITKLTIQAKTCNDELEMRNLNMLGEKWKEPMIHDVHFACANANNVHVRNAHISHAMIASKSNSSVARTSHDMHRHHAPHDKIVHVPNAKKNNVAMVHLFLITVLMLPMCYLPNLVKLLLLMLGLGTRMVKLVFGFQNLMSLTSKDPTQIGYLKQKPKLVL
jgi:hypothetical protein